MELWFDKEKYDIMEQNFGKNNGIIHKTIELRLTKEKHMIDYQKLWNFDL